MKNLVAVLLLLPALAAAQEQAAPQLQEDPRAARFRDVERGVFIGVDVGYLTLGSTPTADQAKNSLAGAGGGRAGGLVLGVNAGVDLGSRVSLALFAQGGNLTAGPNYGAFSLLSAGLDARLAFASWRDRNDWERLFAYVHGRGSWARTYPEGLFGTKDVLLAGGIGIDYYTKLRHFSIGAAADGVYATQAKSFGIAVYPTLRYTF
ncbi:MAG TPA: adventurous gliding motility protein CglE [Anaeromyxobacter sp.]